MPARHVVPHHVTDCGLVDLDLDKEPELAADVVNDNADAESTHWNADLLFGWRDLAAADVAHS
jgi:hypothetical protein